MSIEQDRSIRNMVKSYIYSVGGMLAMEGAVKYDYIANQAKIDEMRKNFQLSMALIEGHLSTIVYMEGGVLSRLFVAGVIGAVTYIAAERHNIKKK